MSSSNGFPEGIDYIDNIDKILSSNWPDFLSSTSGNASADGISAVQLQFLNPSTLKPILADLLSVYNPNNPIPSNFDNFIGNYIGSLTLFHPTVLSSLGGSFAAETLIRNAFYKSYAYSILERQGLQSDWDGVIDITSPSIETQFKNAWKSFVETIPLDSTGHVDLSYTGPHGEALGDRADVFFNAFAKFLSIGTKIQNSTTISLSLNGTSVTTVNVPSYESIYTAFFGSTAGFATFMQHFYQDALKQTGGGDPSKGFFIPSQQLGAFIDAVAKQATTPLLNTASSVTTDQSGRPAVINRIFKLLVLLITTLQGVAAAQANRLTLYTQWTRAYTDMMNQIPKFNGNDANSILRDDGVGYTSPGDFPSQLGYVQDPNDSTRWVLVNTWNYSRIGWTYYDSAFLKDINYDAWLKGHYPTHISPGAVADLKPFPGPIGSGYNPGSDINRTVTVNPGDIGDKAKRASIRQELNDGISAQVTERIRSYRDSVTNDSKAMQSVVNQSNDAVSQQTNMATALLQTLSSLLGSIFR